MISDRTLSHRLDLRYARGLVEPRSVIGDSRAGRLDPGSRRMRRVLPAPRCARPLQGAEDAPLLLALDWHGS
ncbi:MAG: hypothetical protein ACYCU0_10425 [Solirubrobacteraceae bacterium]